MRTACAAHHVHLVLETKPLSHFFGNGRFCLRIASHNLNFLFLSIDEDASLRINVMHNPPNRYGIHLATQGGGS